MSDSSDADTNVSPTTATTTDVQPIFSPGSSANSETVRALMNDVSAATARIRCSCPEAWGWASRSDATEMATKSSPMSAPATPALPRKKS